MNDPPRARCATNLSVQSSCALQRFKEHDELPLLLLRQELEGGSDRGGLALVAQDGLPEGEGPRAAVRRRARRAAVVHQTRPCAHAPERRGAYLQARCLPTVLDDAIARADVVQQEV